MNIIKLSLLSSTMLFFTACGGGSSDPVTEAVTEPVSIDFTGTWNYKLTTQNTVCDDLTSEGTISFSESDGNSSSIGDFIIDGNIFDDDVDGNCYLQAISGSEDISDAEIPKTQTLDELYNFFYDSFDANLSEEDKDIMENIEYSNNTNSEFEISFTTPEGEVITGLFTKS